MTKALFYTFFLITIPNMAIAQFEANYDENKVPKFEVPDPMITFDGTKVQSTEQWEKIRRPELYTFFESHVYGKVPDTLDGIAFKTLEEGTYTFNETTRRKQIEVTLKKGGRSLSFNILMYLPQTTDKVPVFLGYNFYGNHTITKDENIIVPRAWTQNNDQFGIDNNVPTAASRGVRAHRWDVKNIIANGFGLATIYYGEVDPDKNDFNDGIHALFYQKNQSRPQDDEWGSIAAWAFALTKALDYFETDPDVDETKVVVFGHSRLGKTSLWAGATDKRFAGVISNNSGCGGAALSKRRFGETLATINNAFPHWFADNFNAYSDNEEALPVDQHQLLALIAPRPLYVASAVQDEWADPKGEFLSAKHATRVYHLFNEKGIETEKMPEINIPIINTVAYHIRSGKHDVTDFDWEQYIKWAKQFVK